MFHEGMLYKTHLFLLAVFISFPSNSQSSDDFSQNSKTHLSKNFSEQVFLEKNSSGQPQNKSFTIPTEPLYESQKFNNLYNLNPKFQIHNIRSSVFKISKVGLIGSVSSGTAFYIGDNRFVTNFHVISPVFSLVFSKYLTQSYLKYKGKEISFQEILALDYKNDLAVLKLNEKDFERIKHDLVPLKLSPVSKIPNLHEGLIYGYTSLFQEKFFSEIHFKNYKRKNLRDNLEIHTNKQITGGMSGSPVLIENQVIGVLKEGLYNVATATPSETLISLLENSKKTNYSFHPIKDYLHLRERALKGDKKAILELTVRNYFLRHIIPFSTKKIINHYIKKNDLNKLNSKLSHPFFDNINPKLHIANQFYKNKNNYLDESLKIYEDLAQEGLTQAILSLASIAKINNLREESLKLYELAGLKGSGFSSYVTGLYKDTINPSTLYPISAEEWFKISLHQGYLPALFKLISFYKEKGKLKEAKNLEKALNIYKLRPNMFWKLKKAHKKYKEWEKNNLAIKIASYPEKSSCLQVFK